MLLSLLLTVGLLPASGATRLARQGLDLARAQGNTQEAASFTTLLGLALYQQQSLRQAEPVLRDAAAQWERIAKLYRGTFLPEESGT